MRVMSVYRCLTAAVLDRYKSYALFWSGGEALQDVLLFNFCMPVELKYWPSLDERLYVCLVQVRELLRSAELALVHVLEPLTWRMASFVVLLFLVGSVIGKFERGRYIACYDRKDRGASYKGVEIKTEDGCPCVNWGQAISAGAAQAWKVPARQNYCRNPNGNTGLWCYTAIKQKQPCSVPACNGVPIKISPDAVNSSQALMTRAGRTLSAGNALLPDDQLTVQRNWQMCFWSQIRQTLVWWKADLKSVYLVKSVGFYSTSSGRRYNGLQIHVGNGSNTEKQCGKTFAHTGVSFKDTVYLDCGNGIHGRYVTISRSNELVICEIQINVDKPDSSEANEGTHSTNHCFLIANMKNEVKPILKNPVIANTKVTITCDDGYEPKKQTVTCEENGKWSEIKPCRRKVGLLDWKIVKPLARLSTRPYKHETIASNAVDGIIPQNPQNTGGGLGFLQCAVSKYSRSTTQPKALSIDMYNTYSIKSVKLYLRDTYRASWQNGLSVYVGQNESTSRGNTKCGHTYDYSTHGNTPVFSCPPWTKGRFIYLVRELVRSSTSSPHGVQVCEVEVLSVLSCGRPPIFNTVHQLSGYELNDTVHYQCKKGYKGDGGMNASTCRTDGTWTKPTLQCEREHCEKPTDPLYGHHQLLSNDYSLGSQVKFFCVLGYELKGEAVISCNSSEKWQPNIPTCTVLHCPILASTTLRRVRVLGRKVSDTAIYSCIKGYELLGSCRRTCSVANGSTFWSPLPPRCAPAKCPNPSLLSNGKMKGTDYSYLKQIIFECNDGYFLFGGSDAWKCNENGKWQDKNALTGNFPRCEAIDCGTPSVPEYGVFEGKNHKFGGLVTYTCDDGFKREGAARAHCMANGLWSASPPNCIQLQCPIFKRPRNGRIFLRGTTVGSNVKISCNPGYDIKVAEERVGPGMTEFVVECKQFGSQHLASSAWTGPTRRFSSEHLVVCQAKDCGTLPNIRLAKISYEPSTLFGSKAIYECIDGYEIASRDAVRFCETNGRWNGTEPKCTAPCGKPRILPGHFEYINSTGISFGDFAFYHCGKRHLPKIPQKFRCESNGQWKPTEKSIPCTDVDCGRPTDPMFGYHQKRSKDYKFGSHLKFHCYFGYKLSSGADSLCRSSGKWQPSPPNCTVMSCSKLPDIPSATIEVTGTQVNDTVNYKCNKGYRLLGSKHRICLVHPQSGTTFWTSSAPLCYSERCPEYGFDNKSDNYQREKKRNNLKDEKCRKCCKMAAKTNSEICAQNQYVFVAKVMNVTRSVPGSAEYKMKMLHLIKGTGNLVRGTSLKFSRDRDECSSVECFPLKANQKYFIGGQKYKNGLFNLRQSDNFYVEMVENSKIKQKKSRLIRRCSGKI